MHHGVRQRQHNVECHNDHCGRKRPPLRKLCLRPTQGSHLIHWAGISLASLRLREAARDSHIYECGLGKERREVIRTRVRESLVPGVLADCAPSPPHPNE